MNKLPRSFNRRTILIAATTMLVSVGIALAAVCTICKGSGNGPFACFHCKGTGKSSTGQRCNFCYGRGFTPCSSCRGSGQK